MTTAEAVTIHVPAMLRGCCGGARELSFPAPSVRAALEEIERQYPSLHRQHLRRDRGRAPPREPVRQHVVHMRDREGLDTPLVPGDVLTILPAVSGG